MKGLPCSFSFLQFYTDPILNKCNISKQLSVPTDGFAMMLLNYKWKEEVLESKDPVLVDFWADWCGPCRAMNPILESLAKDYKVCKVNVDKNNDLANRYRVSSIPRLMLFHRGKVVWDQVGAVSEATIRRQLESLQ